MLAAIDGAERSVGLATYIFEPGPGRRPIRGSVGPRRGPWRRGPRADRWGRRALQPAAGLSGAARPTSAHRRVSSAKDPIFPAIFSAPQPPQTTGRGWAARVLRRNEHPRMPACSRSGSPARRKTFTSACAARLSSSWGTPFAFDWTFTTGERLEPASGGRARARRRRGRPAGCPRDPTRTLKRSCWYCWAPFRRRGARSGSLHPTSYRTCLWSTHCGSRRCGACGWRSCCPNGGTFEWWSGRQWRS